MSYIQRRAGALTPVPAARIQSKAIEAFETAGTAALFGAIVGVNAVKGKPIGQRMPELMKGLPIDLAVGVIGHAVAFLNIVPKQFQDHVHAVSNGALSSYGSVLGNYMGVRMAGGAADSENNETAKQMLNSGEGQIRGLSQDPTIASLQQANPHLTFEEVERLVTSVR